jgi:four helix bundle protein
MTPDELRGRTKAFALRVIKLVDAMPRGRASQVIARQLLRSATSVGANYRAACHAQSKADFTAKVSIVLEEADESLYWLELIVDSGLMKAGRLKELMQEASELVAIVSASRKTARGQRKETEGTDERRLETEEN